MKHEIINTCPICSSNGLEPHLSVKDHYYSKEEFQILLCPHCTLGITSPQPKKDLISDYYDSQNYISHGTKNSGLISRLYGLAQKWNFNNKLQLIKSLTKNKTIFDHGAGSGYFVANMIKKGFIAEGCEPSEQARKNAKAQYGIDLHTKLPNSTFDCVTMWHVLEHIHDPVKTISSLLSRLNPGGHILIALPNYNSQDAIKYGSHWAGLDVPRHLWHFNAKAIKILGELLGLQYISTEPMKLDSYYVSLLSETYRGGNKISGLISGLMSNLNAGGQFPYSSQIYVFKKHN